MPMAVAADIFDDERETMERYLRENWRNEDDESKLLTDIWFRGTPLTDLLHLDPHGRGTGIQVPTSRPLRDGLIFRVNWADDTQETFGSIRNRLFEVHGEIQCTIRCTKTVRTVDGGVSGHPNLRLTEYMGRLTNIFENINLQTQHEEENEDGTTTLHDLDECHIRFERRWRSLGPREEDSWVYSILFFQFVAERVFAS